MYIHAVYNVRLNELFQRSVHQTRSEYEEARKHWEDSPKMSIGPEGASQEMLVITKGGDRP